MSFRKITVKSGNEEFTMNVTEEEYQRYYRPWWQQKKHEQRNREVMEQNGYTEESYEAWRDNASEEVGIPDMEVPRVDELVEKKLLLGVLADAIDSLLPEERELAIKVFGEEMSVYEYARVKGGNRRTLDFRKNKVMEKLRHFFRERGFDVYNCVEVFMSEKEMALYEQLERDMLLPFSDGDIDAVNAAALANKLLQMADGAVYDENGNVKHIHDRKLEALEDLIEAANGKPVLIAYWYKHDLQRIVERTGAVGLDTAEDMKKWNAGEIPVAAIHPASAGHGLNLQAGGSTLVWFGLTWSLELYQQMNARLWRQGQEETVVIHHLIARGTLDERVMAALEKKDCGQSALVDAVKARIGGVE